MQQFREVLRMTPEGLIEWWCHLQDRNNKKEMLDERVKLMSSVFRLVEFEVLVMHTS